KQTDSYTRITQAGKLLKEIGIDHITKRNRKNLEFQVSNDNKATMLIEEHFNIFDYEVYDEGMVRVYSHLREQGTINRMFVQNDINVLKIKMSEDRLEEYFERLVRGGTIG